MKKIDINTLKNIVKEELQKINENFDHQSAKKIVSSASNLLKALDGFQNSDSTEEMKASVTNHLDGLRKNLEDMIQNPLSYVPKINNKKVKTNNKKVVTFKKI